MSGAKRRSGYRKSVAADALDGRPEPDAALGERLARVEANLGANQLAVRLARPVGAGAGEVAGAAGAGAGTDAGAGEGAGAGAGAGLGAGSGVCAGAPPSPELAIAILPQRFHKAVWVRRGGFLIVAEVGPAAASGASAAAGPASAAGSEKLRCVVPHGLLAPQVTHLRARGLWPLEVEEAVRGGGGGGNGGGGGGAAAAADIDEKGDEGEEAGDEDDDDDNGGGVGALALPSSRSAARAGDLPELDESIYAEGAQGDGAAKSAPL